MHLKTITSLVLFALMSMNSGTIFAAKTASAVNNKNAKSPDYPSMVVPFKAGDASLSNEMKDQVKKLVEGARSKGKIEDIHIAAWSDQPFPKDKDLPKGDRDLAKQRADNIKKFLKQELKQKDKDIEIANMATRSTWMGILFETDGSEVKANIEGKRHEVVDLGDDDDDDKREIASRVKELGKPSVAVVVIEFED